MEKRFILHFLTPLKNVSPFDVNMAVDAGYDVVVPYTDVDLKEVSGLAQDAMFSRPPDDAKRTAILIGGRDPLLAIEMFEAAKAAMFPPFQLSVLVDPSGAFTTAAGMIAVAGQQLKKQALELAGRKVAVFGATGPVGAVAGLIAAKAGAKVTLVGYDGLQRVTATADAFGERFGTALAPADGSDDAKKLKVLEDAEVVLAAGRAGTQILKKEQLSSAKELRVAIDINAVPPSGIEGVDAFDDGKPVEGAQGVGVGALAVGNVKFKTEHELLASMRDAGKPLYLSFAEAFEVARKHAQKNAG